MNKIVNVNCIIFILLFGLNSLLSAQTVQVSGVVTSADDGQPLPGVSVVAVGTALGTITNTDGRYSFDNVPADATLRFSFIGKATQNVAVDGRREIDVVMLSDAQTMDELIVVAYGTATRASFTGSATTIRAEELERRRASNITKILDGLAPGIQVTSGSGQPGSGSSVYIRGLGSINASNTPLYVVDGIPYDGNINAISPNDIETITVLKDASAGALYGSRGANGVVMITTKRGHIGVPVVNVRANFGVSSRSIPRYETLNAKEFIEANFSAFRNLQTNATPDQAGINALSEMSVGAQRIFGSAQGQEYNPYNLPIAQLIDPQTGLIRSDAQLLWEDDWLDEVTRDDAYRQEYTIDVSGGVEKIQYLFSFGYLKDNGILETTDFRRYTGRTNIEAQPADWLSVGMGTNFAQATTNLLGATGSASSNVWNSAQLMGPIYPVYQRDPTSGNFILDEFGNKMFDYGPTRPSGGSPDFNSIATLYDDKFSNTVNSISSRGYFTFGDMSDGWTKGLAFTVSLGFDYRIENGFTYYNPFFGNAENSSGRITKRSGNTMSYTTNQMLSYKKTLLEHHHIDIMGAHEYYDYQYSFLSGQKTGFPFGGLFEPDAASTVTDVTGYSDRYSIQSFLGRVNYNFDNKYHLSASLRSDASSRFHKDFRWKTFWSLGGNYRISREDFMLNYSSWLDNLSVRLSYGHQGNDAVLKTVNGVRVSDYYPWQGLYDLGYPNANQGGAMVTSLENKDLTWEKSAIWNIGLDAAFLGRFQVSLEWYHRKTTDLLLNYPKALSTGFDDYFRNSGSMINTGFEMTLAGSIVKTQDFEWNAMFMGATIRNKVTQLTDSGQDIISGTRIIREGEPYNSYFVIRSAGVDPLNGRQLFWADKDINDDGDEIDVEPYITNNTQLGTLSRYVAGNRFPSLFGSFSTQLRYRAFDLSIAANYSIGGKMTDGVYQAMMSFYYPGQTKHKDLLKAWRQPGDVTSIPRYEIGAATVYTDDMLINASYFSIKNVSLGYTLPTRITNSIGIGYLRIYCAADNLYMFNHLKGMDPQYAISGGTDYVYAPTRLVSVGIDLKF